MKTSTAKATLIATLRKYGVSITTHDIKQILSLGLDTYLLKKGMAMPDKFLDEAYLIIHEMRERL